MLFGILYGLRHIPVFIVNIYIYMYLPYKLWRWNWGT